MTATARKTITASRRAKDEVERRHLTIILQHLRSKAEGNPQRYGGIGSRIDRAERAVLDGHYVQAREHVEAIDIFMLDKDETADIQAQQAAAAKLAEARDEPTATAESGVSTRDGFLWLANKGRLTKARVDAGLAFRQKYAKAHGVPVKSCLDDSGGGGDATPVAGNSHAKFEIDGVRKHIISSVGHATGSALIKLLEEVCGEGGTVRKLASGDAKKADILEAEFGLALDLAGVYLGVIRT
jgi:hypothetical protein